MDRIGFYWKNSTADAVGEKYGVSLKDLKAIAPRVKTLTQELAVQRKAGKLRYRDLPYDQDLVDAVNSEVEHFRDKCEILVVVGVGADALGNNALQSALNPSTYNLHSDRSRNGPQLFVLDTTDPDQVKAIVDFITPKLKRTIVNVVSRTTESAETAAQFILIRDLLLKKLGKRYKENVLATLDSKGGVLREYCVSEGYRTIETPTGIGGPYGILSAPGLFSAAMTGLDIEALMGGAQDMDKRCKEIDLFKNPAAMIAAIHYILHEKGKSISIAAPYSASLQPLALWLCRLWSECLEGRSNPKKKDMSISPCVVKTPGTLNLGSNDKIVTFFEVERFNQKLSIPDTLKSVESLKHFAGQTFQSVINSEKLAEEYAMLEAKRPSTTVLFPRISAETLGQFIYMYEVAISYLGEMMELSPAEMPADPAGKDAVDALLGKPGCMDLAKTISAIAQCDPKFKL